MKVMKKVVRIMFFAFVVQMFLLNSVKTQAASAMIQFSLNEQKVKVGKEFTVIMEITSSDSVIGGADVYVSYDSTRMQFVSGGKYVSGNAGLLHVEAKELSSENANVKFSLQFMAIAPGNCAVNISDKATVTGSDGTKMSTSSNRVSINIKGKAGETYNTETTVDGTISTIPAELSDDNELVSLKVSDGILDPVFSPDVKKYSLTVDNTVDNLYFSYIASDSNAVVRFVGNEGLVEGKNKVKVVVKAQNGNERTYSIKVKKESYAETQENDKATGGDSDSVQFEVKNENGKVVLKNRYSFEIINVDESVKVPAGYTKTSVLLYGVNVTAYTASSNLDSDYLIMYCKNEEGETDFYQFDRNEKTLQRYTGDLVERINQTEGTQVDKSVMTAKEYKSNISQMAVILAILVGVCVMLLTIIMSMLLKQVKAKSKRIEDELDF